MRTYPSLLRNPVPDPTANDSILIGLINNMPDAALLSTELQFRALLNRAAQDLSFKVRLFTMPRPRTEVGSTRLGFRFADFGDLWASSFDGLIVTGTEPKAISLRDEPCWHTLTKLIEWAEDHTVSTIWSCLAAHAAVLYLDGVERRPFSTKLCGVFECERAMNHTILDGLPASWHTPHSRCNDLPKEVLAARGYNILSNSPRAGVDMFVRQRRSLFLFVQGHLEYDRDVLLREYRRDVRRFLGRERNCYPDLPDGYLEKEIADELRTFRRRALRRQDVRILSSFPDIASVKPVRAWEQPAISIYRNWLSYLTERKKAALAKCHLRLMARPEYT